MLALIEPGQLGLVVDAQAYRRIEHLRKKDR